VPHPYGKGVCGAYHEELCLQQWPQPGLQDYILPKELYCFAAWRYWTRLPISCSDVLGSVVQIASCSTPADDTLQFAAAYVLCAKHEPWLKAAHDVDLCNRYMTCVHATHNARMQSLHGRASSVALIELAAVSGRGAVVVGVRNWPTQLKRQLATLDWVDVLCLLCANAAKVCCCSCHRLTSVASACPPILGQCMVMCGSEDVCGGCF
jgi:hypothetical protein